MKYKTREQWLNAAVDLMRPLFKENFNPIPKKVRVTCGWPSKSALAAKSRRIGECWSPSASGDKVTEMFISPYLHDVANPGLGVLETLVHEAVHAAVGVEHGHKAPFGKMARAIGLEGKLTSTHAGETLMKQIKAWAKKLGQYPHAKLDYTKGPRKKQGTRLIKCECSECGYTVRTTKKWLVEVGAPICPAKGHGAMQHDEIEESEKE